MKQFAKRHHTNKLPQQTSEATLSTRYRMSYQVDFLFKFLHKTSFLPDLFTLIMPTESLYRPGVYVFGSMNIIFYSVITYCSGKLMLAAQVINQSVMRLKVKLKIKTAAHTCHILLKLQSSLSFKRTWWAPIIWWPSSPFLCDIGYSVHCKREEIKDTVFTWMKQFTSLKQLAC